MPKKNETISVSLLMEELNLSWRGLKNICKQYNLPPLKRNGTVLCSIADQISFLHRNLKIDWYKFKLDKKDSEIGGPLYPQNYTSLSENLESWYSKLGNQNKNNTSSDFILGVVCNGGFLRGRSGKENDPFMVSIHSGINVFIGEKGSGKSTALSLVTLLSDSTSEKTDILVNAIIALIQENKKDEDRWVRRLWETLKDYGINNYSCFFKFKNKTFVFYVNAQDRGYDLLIRNKEIWSSIKNISEKRFPEMQVLRQGEVFRIADDESNFVLNNILDELYPELYEKRKKIARQINNLSQQYKSLKTSRFKLERQIVNKFLNKRFKQIGDFRRKYQENKYIPEILNNIESELLNYEIIPPHLKNSPVIELFYSIYDSGIEDELICLYIGRISKFLRNKIVEVKHLIDDEKTTYNKKEISNLIKQNLEMMFDFLQNRLHYIKDISDYLESFIYWDKYLENITKNSLAFLEKEIEIVTTQDKYCQEISNIVKGKININLYTDKGKETIEKNKEILQHLKNIQNHYNFLQSADMKVRKEELSIAFETYNNTITKLLDILKNLNKNLNKNNSSINHPIKVELWQGSKYRSFEQLSFGQKSGIILMIALKMTKANILAIDQPEDNLDSNSIINMLSPTLLEESQKSLNRAIIIATHDPNLIMTLGNHKIQPNIFVMNSSGDFGRINISDSLKSRSIVEHILEYLEGGVDAFEQKIELYEHFLVNLSDNNQDVNQDFNIAMIERSYRRRTIDNLRNYLQPVISDRFILRSLSHEFNNLAYERENWLNQSLLDLKSDIDNCQQDKKSLNSLLQKLDNFSNDLNKHLNQIDVTIQQIDEMDTKPKPEDFDFYTLLKEVVDPIRERKQQEVEFDLKDDLLKNIKVYADKNHTKLILRNLFKNACRATEIKEVDYSDDIENYHQKIKVYAVKISRPTKIAFQIQDNGIGISPEIQKKLYVEKCTDRKSGDHGNGAIIIKKLLDLNEGAIEIIGTKYKTLDSGTIHQITLPMRRKK